MRELGGPDGPIDVQRFERMRAAASPVNDANGCPYQPRETHKRPAVGFWLAIVLVISVGVALAWVTWP